MRNYIKWPIQTATAQVKSEGPDQTEWMRRLVSFFDA